MFIYQKTIDRSTLRQGFQIPVEFHDLLKAIPGDMCLKIKSMIKKYDK